MISIRVAFLNGQFVRAFGCQELGGGGGNTTAVDGQVNLKRKGHEVPKLRLHRLNNIK